MTAPSDNSEHPLAHDDDPGMAYLLERGLGALADRMGIVMTEFTRERAVATMPVEGNTQPIMLLHGGAYVVLGETLGSMHANYLAPAGFVGVGVDINATHTGSATRGLVTGICTPIKVGRMLTVHEIIVNDEHGRRCSTVRITNLYKPFRGLGK
ncbi:MAG: hotdog fold thioesterase [Leucobacter sp.]